MVSHNVVCVLFQKILTDAKANLVRQAKSRQKVFTPSSSFLLLNILT